LAVEVALKVMMRQYYGVLMLINGLTSEMVEALPIRTISYPTSSSTGINCGKEGIA